MALYNDPVSNKNYPLNFIQHDLIAIEGGEVRWGEGARGGGGRGRGEVGGGGRRMETWVMTRARTFKP